MKTIIDYPAYQISETGDVYSPRLNRVLRLDKSGKKGYLRVTLCKLVDGAHTKKRMLIHRLVAQHYINNPLGLPHINHIDNNPSNNNRDNLEWCTHSENMIHCHKQGRCSNIIASDQAKAVMAEKMISKFESLLGHRFIEYGSKNKRGYVIYHCVRCDKILKSRTDSPGFAKKGICLSCSKIKI